MLEEEIVLNIARHYGENISQTIVLHNINRMENLLNYLERVQRGSRSSTGQASRINQARGNQSMGQNNNYNRNFRPNYNNNYQQQQNQFQRQQGQWTNGNQQYRGQHQQGFNRNYRG